MSLELTPISEEGDFIKLGISKKVTIELNAKLRMPIIEQVSSLTGYEDTPIKLFGDNKNIINAYLRGDKRVQTLELEISELNNLSLVRIKNGVISSPLNTDKNGSLTDKYRTAYDNYDDIYLLPKKRF